MEKFYKLFIGDNLKILDSALAQSYCGKIKFIYIDPPYNTNTYKSYADKVEEREWMAHMESTLRSLRPLLNKSGSIFISIDDSEYAVLKLICDKIFSRRNFLGTFITRQAQRSNSKFINVTHEYVLCYANDKTRLEGFSVKRVDIPEQKAMIDSMTTEIRKILPKGREAAEKRLRELIEHYCDRYGITWLKNYNRVDDEGNIYFASDLSTPGEPREVNIPAINLRLAPLKTRTWASDAMFEDLHNRGLLVFLNNRPYRKKYLRESRDNAPSVLNFYSRFGAKDLESLGLRDLFDTPKPVELIKFLIRIANVSNGDIVLDCFAGSGATGQAVIEVNREDGKSINCILIQREEAVSKKSLSFKRCEMLKIPPYISEIAKLRLARALEKFEPRARLEIFKDE